MTDDDWLRRWLGRPGPVALALFAVAAVPLLLGTVPPLQDLPNHLASAFIAEHLTDYPDLQANGFLRSNVLLALWFHVLGGPLGLVGAGAALPRADARRDGNVAGLARLERGRARAAPVRGAPSPGPWFTASSSRWVSSTSPSAPRERSGPWHWPASGSARPPRERRLDWRRSAWAHGTATRSQVTVATGLVGLEVLLAGPWRDWPRRLPATLGPFVPAVLLSLVTAAVHWLKPEARRTPLLEAGVLYLPPGETLWQLWSHGPGGFGWLEASALLPAGVLLLSAWKERSRPVPYFRWPAMAALLVLYFALPASLSNWGLFDARMLPFLWAGLLLRAPVAMPRPLVRGLAAAAVLYARGDGGGLPQARARAGGVLRGHPPCRAGGPAPPAGLRAARERSVHRAAEARLGPLRSRPRHDRALALRGRAKLPAHLRPLGAGRAAPPAIEAWPWRTGLPRRCARGWTTRRQLRSARGDGSSGGGPLGIAEPRFDYVLTWQEQMASVP